MPECVFTTVIPMEETQPFSLRVVYESFAAGGAEGARRHEDNDLEL